MLTTMETCLQKLKRVVRKAVLDPGLQQTARVAAWAGSGFVLSAASVNSGFQPLALGLIISVTGWRALVAALGAAAGYRILWGAEGLLGSIWAALGCILALALGKGERIKQMPLLLPALTSVVTAVTGLTFLFFRRGAPLRLFFLWLFLAPLSAMLFRRSLQCRESVMQWILGGVITLALAGLGPLGFCMAGVFSVWSSFPAAAMAGLGLDLARITPVPMGVVICGAWFGRMIPFRDRWMRFCVPGIAYISIMGLCGSWDPWPLPGLVSGGIIGYFLPPRTGTVHRSGEMGIAQVRLEMTAGVLAQTQKMLLEVPEPVIDEGALLNRAINRACGNCTGRENCVERLRLSGEYLHSPLSFACRRPWEIQGELLRAQERLKDLQADRQRRKEYRSALLQQYRFLSVYLQKLSDELPRRGERIQAYYRLEVSARSRSKERSCGDRCLAFPGAGCRYYVLLCDGMGTGLGAAHEGQTAGHFLQQMLGAGFPPEHAFRSINSILALRGQAGAVTLDLAEIRLDSGRVSLYKWGAAPSFLLGAKKTEKIGTATPPPGLSVEDARETVDRLSLRRGEMLILVSDGAQIGEILRRGVGPLPPGELAEWLLKECGSDGEDDATVAVLRLKPRRMST